MSRTRVAAGLLALLGASLTLAACSSSKSGQGTTAPATSSRSSTSSSPASSSATPPSHSVLAAIPVQAGDLPAGWKGSKADTSGDAQAQAAMHQCVGGRDTRPDKIDTVYGDDFDLGNATISSSAGSYKSADDIAADEQLLTGPKVESCYKTVLRELLAKTLPAGATIGAITFHLTPGSGGGPSNLIATGEGTIGLTAQGQSATLYVGLAFIAGPLVEAQVSWNDVGQPVDESLIRQVITAVAQRAANS